LRERGEEVIKVKEPGTTPLGEKLRLILLSGEVTSPEVASLLFAAARTELLKTVILPALAKGKTVLADRSIVSSLAFQGGGNGVSLTWLKEINLYALDTPPDLVILLDLPAAEAKRRIAKRALINSDLDTFESKDLEYFEKVRASFISLSHELPFPFVTVSTLKSPNDCVAELRRILNL
jgi:dTMP kinase